MMAMTTSSSMSVNPVLRIDRNILEPPKMSEERKRDVTLALLQ
jgi:hypothetical protein